MRLAEQPIENFSAEHLNGWDSSIELNIAPRVGLLANIGGNYGQRLCSVCTTSPISTRF